MRLDAELAESHIGTGVRMKKMRVCKCCTGLSYLHSSVSKVMETQRQAVSVSWDRGEWSVMRTGGRAKNVGGDKLQRCRLQKVVDRMQQQRHNNSYLQVSGSV